MLRGRQRGGEGKLGTVMQRDRQLKTRVTKLVACMGCDPTRMRGSVRAGKGPGQVGSLQGLNTRPSEGITLRTHTPGQREEDGRWSPVLKNY